MATFYCTSMVIKDNGSTSCNVVCSVEADVKPENKHTSTRHADYYTDWFDTLEEAQEFVNDNKS